MKGNGHERDFIGDQDTYIMDMYNPNIFPGDSYAKQGISRQVKVTGYDSQGINSLCPIKFTDSDSTDENYLSQLSKNLDEALEEFHPDILYYNAGQCGWLVGIDFYFKELIA
jgi:histone deacetylase 11